MTPSSSRRAGLVFAGTVLAIAGLVAFALLCLGVPRARGGDDPERQRKARAALALAAAARPAGPSVAPAPRAVAFPGYTEGYREAMRLGVVFVAYIGCTGEAHPVEPIPGAVVARAAALDGYPPQTIVVGYPSNGRMLEHARLDCSKAVEVPAAVEAARKKLGAAVEPRAPVAPRPLDWQIRAAPAWPTACAGLT